VTTEPGARHSRRRRAVLSCVGIALLLAGSACADQRARTSTLGAREETNVGKPEQADQTLEEFLGLDDASVVRQRDLQQHNEIERVTQTCVRAQGFAYTPVPPPKLPANDMSPPEYAQTFGFGVAAMYLGLDNSAGVLEEPRDPNGEYIESLDATDRARFFKVHASCVDQANSAVLGPIEAARKAVRPYLDASRERLVADPEYVAAQNEWSTCLGSTTAIQATSMEAVRAYVANELMPLAARLAEKNDVQGLRNLLQREIELATASSACGAAFQERISPLISRYEGEMLRAHPDEFNRLLDALNGRPAGS
jgi:hypothetical protein